MGGFLCNEFGGLIVGGAYTWRGSSSEFYSVCSRTFLLEVGNNVHRLTIY